MSIPLYFILNPLIAALGIVYTSYRAPRFGLPIKSTLDVAIIAVTAGLVSARMYFVLFEAPFIFSADPVAILRFWEGGFAVYGGLLGGTFSVVVASRIYNINLAKMLQVIQLPVSFGYSLGRVVCFMTGCCYGGFCDYPWSIGGRHPTQLYAACGELVVIASVHSLESRPRLRAYSSPLWCVCHGLNRLIMEQFRIDPRGQLWGHSQAQWISISVILIGAIWGVVLFLRQRAESSSAI